MPKQTVHPGKVLRDEYLEPRGINVTDAAKMIGVTRQALNNVVNGKAGITPEMLSA
jgi:antitoxin HigA-1